MKLELMRDESTTFPEIESPEKYTELSIWHCKYRSIEKIALFKNLKKLEIATYLGADFEPLSKLKKLEFLHVVHLPKLKDLKGVSELVSLEEIQIETLPSWDASGKKLLISDLVPLGKLGKIKKIELMGVLPIDGNFACLSECESLEELNLQKRPSSGVASLNKLHELKPALKGNFLNFI